MPNHYKITPSEMTFLYQECKHCFVNKIKFGIDRPSIPLPGIFTTIAALQKDHFSDKRTEDFCPDLPPGKVVLGEKWIRSKPISFQGIESTCYIKGRFDVVMALDDGTYLVGDFKTGDSTLSWPWTTAPIWSATSRPANQAQQNRKCTEGSCMPTHIPSSIRKKAPCPSDP